MEIQFSHVNGPELLPRLTKVAKETFLEAFGPMHDPTDMALYLEKEFSPEAMRRKIHDPKSFFFLIHQDNTDLGYTRINQAEEKSGPAELQRIYIYAKYKGLGLGRRAMAHYESLGRSWGSDELILGVWDEDEKAFGFYTHMGYSKFGRKPFPFGTDIKHVFLMKKGRTDN